MKSTNLDVLIARKHVRRGRLMVSALDSGASGPGGRVQALAVQEHYIVFLSKHFALTLPPFTQVYGYRQIYCF